MRVEKVIGKIAAWIALAFILIGVGIVVIGAARADTSESPKIFAGFSEKDPRALMERVWAGYMPPLLKIQERVWLETTLPDGSKKTGGQYLHTEGIAGKIKGMVVLDEKRTPSDGALLSRDNAKPLSCGVLTQTSRGKQFDRDQKEYGAIVGDTSLNYFELCRILFGDDPALYGFAFDSEGRVVATPKNRERGDCEKSIITVNTTGVIPVITEVKCELAGGIRRMHIEPIIIMVNGTQNIWRAHRTTIEDVNGAKTVIFAKQRTFTVRFGNLDEGALKRGRPTGGFI